ncbi:MAG: ubiquinol-cytochrome c reductase iron-sulfur subunit [Planctomycetales bacterium]
MQTSDSTRPEGIPSPPSSDAPPGATRRTFVSSLTSSAMVAGLAGGYGMLGALAGRYLYPARPPERRWLFVAELTRIGVGDAVSYQAPDGRKVAVTRLESQGTADDFIALSSVCPHLGCQVHWESQNRRFFCPCHNGAFDSQGMATKGPPRDAGQRLAKFPLKVEGGLLFIEVVLSA